jgi:hypothetical protein
MGQQAIRSAEPSKSVMALVVLQGRVDNDNLAEAEAVKVFKVDDDDAPG